MLLDHDITFIYPISLSAIGIIFIACLLTGVAGIAVFLEMVINNIDTIITILLIISALLIIITSIVLKNSLCIVPMSFSTAIAISQLLYYISTGANNIIAIDNSGLSVIWRLIVFCIWAAFGSINIVGTICACGLSLYFAIEAVDDYKDATQLTKTSDDQLKKNFWSKSFKTILQRDAMSLLFIMLAPGIGVGVIGWIINAIFL